MTYEEAKVIAIGMLHAGDEGASVEHALNAARYNGQPLDPQQRDEVLMAYDALESHVALKLAGLL